MAISTAKFLLYKPSISSAMTEPNLLRHGKSKQPIISSPMPVPPSSSSLASQADRLGRFGRFGGKFVPETMVYALGELESAFLSLSRDHGFKVVGLMFKFNLMVVFFGLFEFKELGGSEGMRSVFSHFRCPSKHQKRKMKKVLFLFSFLFYITIYSLPVLQLILWSCKSHL